MKILVDKLPNKVYAEECLFAQKTGNYFEDECFNWIEECDCKLSKNQCELQLYGECPYLKEVEEI